MPEILKQVENPLEKKKQDRSDIFDKVERTMLLVASVLGGGGMLVTLSRSIGLAEAGLLEFLKYLIPILGGILGYLAGVRSARKKE